MTAFRLVFVYDYVSDNTRHMFFFVFFFVAGTSIGKCPSVRREHPGDVRMSPWYCSRF